VEEVTYPGFVKSIVPVGDIEMGVSPTRFAVLVTPLFMTT